MSSDYPYIPEPESESSPVLPARLLFGLLAFGFLGLVGGLSTMFFSDGDSAADTTVATDGVSDDEVAAASAAQTSAFLPATATPSALAGALVTPIPTPTTPAVQPALEPVATALPTAIPLATATPQPTLAAARFIPQPDDAEPETQAAPAPTAAPERAPVPTTTPIASPTPVLTPTPVPFTPANVEPGTYYVLASDGLLVRDQPGGSAVTTLDPASAVVATGTAAQTVRLWVEISSPVAGWVAAEFLGTEPPTSGESAAGETAASDATAAGDDGTSSGVDLAGAADAADAAAEATPIPEPTAVPTAEEVALSASNGAGGPSPEQMAALRQCESGGNYAINTGNGYFGAYQFAQSTWDAVAAQFYPDLVGVVPSDASPAEQDAMMIALHSMQGFGPWPGCRASLGLP